ncbi:MAG: hypothetical protein KME28_13805 [Pelatocladus maniniholoensis HA4357-MV3]|uniref:Uncharacterized protein n=1 Tax=Pelatocladus maniniholoensis HA4357-MV3 TaxID=1117104 RepID=A0A9E3LTM9_9NOST|nr:hypothetical protein [Pelatocladus maniniholoensis HA4357-MV3]
MERIAVYVLPISNFKRLTDCSVWHDVRSYRHIPNLNMAKYYQAVTNPIPLKPFSQSQKFKRAFDPS